MVKNISSTGEILHFTGARFRMTGVGNLITTYQGLDNLERFWPDPMQIPLFASREPVRLADFTNQRAQFIFRTSEINESFNISKIVIFVRPVASEYPQ